MPESGLWVLGGGGHAVTVVDALHPQPVDAVVLLDLAAVAAYAGPLIDVAAQILDEGAIGPATSGRVDLVNGIGKLGPGGARGAVFRRFRHQGHTFARVVHPRAIVSPSAVLEEGAQVLAGAVVGPGATIGANTIVNTGAIIEHGVTIGADSHVASGAVICGDCVIGDDTLVGAGATILQGRVVGTAAVVGAGSAVVHDVADGSVVYGSPAVSSG